MKSTLRNLSHIFCNFSEICYVEAAYLWNIPYLKHLFNILFHIEATVGHIGPVSVPKLELAPELLNAWIDNILRRNLTLMLDKICFRTNPMIALHYMRNLRDKYRTFVGSRLNTIFQLVSVDQLGHLGSAKILPASKDTQKELDLKT